MKKENKWEIIKEQIKNIKEQKFKYFKTYQLGKTEGYEQAKKENMKKIKKIDNEFRRKFYGNKMSTTSYYTFLKFIEDLK